MLQTRAESQAGDARQRLSTGRGCGQSLQTIGRGDLHIRLIHNAQGRFLGKTVVCILDTDAPSKALVKHSIHAKICETCGAVLRREFRLFTDSTDHGGTLLTWGSLLPRPKTRCRSDNSMIPCSNQKMIELLDVTACVSAAFK